MIISNFTFIFYINEIRLKIVTTSFTMNETCIVSVIGTLYHFQSSVLFYINLTSPHDTHHILWLGIYIQRINTPPPYTMHSTRIQYHQLSSIVIPLQLHFVCIFHRTLSTIRHSETLDLSENMILKSIISTIRMYLLPSTNFFLK